MSLVTCAPWPLPIHTLSLCSPPGLTQWLLWTLPLLDAPFQLTLSWVPAFWQPWQVSAILFLCGAKEMVRQRATILLRSPEDCFAPQRTPSPQHLSTIPPPLQRTYAGTRGSTGPVPALDAGSSAAGTPRDHRSLFASAERGVGFDRVLGPMPGTHCILPWPLTWQVQSEQRGS